MCSVRLGYKPWHQRLSNGSCDMLGILVTHDSWIDLKGKFHSWRFLLSCVSPVDLFQSWWFWFRSCVFLDLFRSYFMVSPESRNYRFGIDSVLFGSIFGTHVLLCFFGGLLHGFFQLSRLKGGTLRPKTHGLGSDWWRCSRLGRWKHRAGPCPWRVLAWREDTRAEDTMIFTDLKTLRWVKNPAGIWWVSDLVILMIFFRWTMLSLGKKISEDPWNKSQVAKLVTMYDNVMHTKSVAGIPVPESKCNEHCTRLTRLVHVSEFMITSGVWNNSQKVKQET